MVRILLLAFLKSGVLALAIVFSLSTLIGSLLFIIPGMKYLNYKILPEKPQKIKETTFAIPAKRIINRPPADHPWRGKLAAQTVKI